MKRTLPTDLQILNVIYKRYYEKFAQCKDPDKLYVPIDIKQIADELGIDEDIVFGRLSYHLDKKYANTEVKFVVRLEKGYCINFPLMASVLADLRDLSWKHHIDTLIACAAVLISIISIIISVFHRS